MEPSSKLPVPSAPSSSMAQVEAWLYRSHRSIAGGVSASAALVLTTFMVGLLPLLGLVPAGLVVLIVRWMLVRRPWELEARRLGLRRTSGLFRVEHEGTVDGRPLRIVSNRGSTLMLSMQLSELRWARGFVFDLGDGRLVSGALRWLGLFLNEELYEQYKGQRVRLELEAGHLRLYVSEEGGLRSPLRALREAVRRANIHDEALVERLLARAWTSSVAVIWRSALELLIHLDSDEDSAQSRRLLVELVESDRFPIHKRLVALGLVAEVNDPERPERLLGMIERVTGWPLPKERREAWLLRLLRRDPDLDIALVYALAAYGGPRALGRLRQGEMWAPSERLFRATRWAVGQIQARLEDPAALGNLSLVNPTTRGELSLSSGGRLALKDPEEAPEAER